MAMIVANMQANGMAFDDSENMVVDQKRLRVLCLMRKKNQVYAAVVFGEDEEVEEKMLLGLSAELYRALTSLWSDGAVKRTCARGQQYHLPDSATQLDIGIIPSC